MEFAIFGVTALISIACALAMILSSNAVHSALFLVLNFTAVAVLYLLLQAPFLAMIQITVYAGAIMVLFLFVIMLLGGEPGIVEHDALTWQRPLAIVLGLLLLGEALFVIFGGGASPARSTGVVLVSEVSMTKSPSPSSSRPSTQARGRCQGSLSRASAPFSAPRSMITNRNSTMIAPA